MSSEKKTEEEKEVEKNKIVRKSTAKEIEAMKLKRQQEFLHERIPFSAFKDSGKYKDDLIVIVNGKTFQIQRGVQVMIPRYVYLAIEQSERQRAEAAKLEDM